MYLKEKKLRNQKLCYLCYFLYYYYYFYLVCYYLCIG